MWNNWIFFLSFHPSLFFLMMWGAAAPAQAPSQTLSSDFQTAQFLRFLRRHAQILRPDGSIHPIHTRFRRILPIFAAVESLISHRSRAPGSGCQSSNVARLETIAEQECVETLLGADQIVGGIGARPADIADGFIEGWRNAHVGDVSIQTKYDDQPGRPRPSIHLEHSNGFSLLPAS